MNKIKQKQNYHCRTTPKYNGKVIEKGETNTYK